MKKILITGASGFLGLPITNELASCGEYEVYALTTGRREIILPAGVIVKKGNLLDRKQSKKIIEEIHPDILLHMAWELDEPRYFESTNNLVWLEESLYILRMFTEAGGKYFAFAGSSAEYERFCGFSESERAFDVSLYGKCKRTFNQIASELCSKTGVNYVNLRFFPTLGKGMRSNVAAVAEAVVAFAKNEPFVCKSPYNIWDFINVSDASKAAYRTIVKQYAGTVNIGSGIPYVMGDVFKSIAQKMDCEYLLSLNTENLSKEILVANTNILTNEIGYVCTRDFSDTLDDMIDTILERRRKNENQ